jgi:protoporphyrinogen oxidase
MKTTPASGGTPLPARKKHAAHPFGNAPSTGPAKVAVIAGAGPAGLTAALELLRRTGITPIVFEATEHIGGISKTVNYKGNRIDIGGHRFFSKSDRVMRWWREVMPIQGAPSRDELTLDITYRNRTRSIELDQDGPDPETTDDVLLVRDRLSRIFYLRRFFDYPISLSPRTVRNLGFARISRIGASYLRARLSPISPEHSLEDFFINRFGRELYRTFFKDYTEKVWGLPCDQIGAEWGAQRIKGLSITKAVGHALRSISRRRRGRRGDPADNDVAQKNVETSLIERFLYPKLGPGQLWEKVADTVVATGGTVLTEHTVTGVVTEGERVIAVEVRHEPTGRTMSVPCDYFFSTMPVRELVAGLRTPPPARVREVADGLMYRDFVTVGLLLTTLKIRNDTGVPTVNDLVPDNWIYIQERDVRVGRLQIFNNWSPYLVSDPDKVWIGLEYFCNEGDELWSRPDDEFIAFAIEELARIDIIDPAHVLDSTILRVPKTYPAYFGTYDRFAEVREYLDRFDNLFLVGRNGMHRYNNQDHSMLTAMTAVDNIVAGITDKANLWSINTEMEYHEEFADEELQRTGKVAAA